MEQEVPLIVYSKQLTATADVATDTCATFYEKTFGFPVPMSETLCSGGDLEIKTFTFADKETTCRAWMNLALNNNTANPSDYADLVFLSSMSSEDLDNLLFYSTSKFQKYITKNVL